MNHSNRSPALVLTVVVAVTVAAGLLLLRAPQRQIPSAATPTGVKPVRHAERILLYCAAGIANPVTAVAREYEKEYGVRVDIQFGGSGTLLSNLRLAGQGDLFLAADSSYLEIAARDGMLDESIPLAKLLPVIAVKKGNPKNIRTVEDLARRDIRVALGNPEAASIGKQSRFLLTELRQWDRIQAMVQQHGVFKPTVNELANDVKLGTVDAAIVWDATIKQEEYQRALEAVEMPRSVAYIQEVAIGILHFSNQPTAALHFARYLGSRNKGLPAFADRGFTVVDGDAWADRPQILFYGGAVNRRAIQETLAEFGKREGVEITTIFNGCGILNGQIKLGEKPDVYQTCDSSFMKGVEEKFLPYQKVSETDIVIAVRKGNPRNIRALQDLSLGGLRLGVANERQSTLGTLTARLLKEQKLDDPVQKNVVVNSPTADLLVTQLRTGSLDAVIVYRANTTAATGDLDVIAINHPMARAMQSIAVGRESSQQHLVGRLVKTLRSPKSRERFQRAGFQWIDEENLK